MKSVKSQKLEKNDAPLRIEPLRSGLSDLLFCDELLIKINFKLLIHAQNFFLLTVEYQDYPGVFDSKVRASFR